MNYDELNNKLEELGEQLKARRERIEEHYAYLDKWPYRWLLRDSRKIYKEFKNI